MRCDGCALEALSFEGLTRVRQVDVRRMTGSEGLGPGSELEFDRQLAGRPSPLAWSMVL